MIRKSTVELPFGVLRLIAACILRPLFRFEIRGAEHLACCRDSVILAGNHSGYLDSLAVLVSCPRYFHFLMTEEVFGWGWIGKLVRHANIIPLYKGREKRGMVEALQTLCQGGVICIFPEGKLTQDGELNPFNEGVAFLHQKSGAPIVPFWIEGGFEAWPQTQRWPVFRKVILQFGEPIEMEGCEKRSEIVQTLEQRVLGIRDDFRNTAVGEPAMMGLRLSEISTGVEQPSCRFQT
jgi:1-acyl-sn-glycerol-3-phosphate acyltransferase